MQSRNTQTEKAINQPRAKRRLQPSPGVGRILWGPMGQSFERGILKGFKVPCVLGRWAGGAPQHNTTLRYPLPRQPTWPRCMAAPGCLAVKWSALGDSQGVPQVPPVPPNVYCSVLVILDIQALACGSQVALAQRRLACGVESRQLMRACVGWAGRREGEGWCCQAYVAEQQAQQGVEARMRHGAAAAPRPGQRQYAAASRALLALRRAQLFRRLLTVGLGAHEEGLLPRLEVLLLAAPRLERRRLQRTDDEQVAGAG